MTAAERELTRALALLRLEVHGDIVDHIQVKAEEAIRQARKEEREWTALAGAEVFSKEIDGLGAFELIEMADKIEAHASARAQKE